MIAWRAKHSGLLHIPIALRLNLQCLRPIIWSSKLLEPWVLQCLLCCDTLRWIVNEDPPQKIKEVAGKVTVWRNNLLHYMLVLVLKEQYGETYLKLLHRLNKSPRCAASFLLWIVKL